MDPPSSYPVLWFRFEAPVYERIDVGEIEAGAAPNIARDLGEVAIAEFVEGSGFDHGDSMEAAGGETVGKG